MILFVFGSTNTSVASFLLRISRDGELACAPSTARARTEADTASSKRRIMARFYL